MNLKILLAAERAVSIAEKIAVYLAGALIATVVAAIFTAYVVNAAFDIVSLGW